MADKNEKKEAVYVVYRNGKAKVVSKEAWEKGWLSWWKRTSKERPYYSGDGS